MFYNQITLYLDNGYPMKLKEENEFLIKKDNDIYVVEEGLNIIKLKDYLNKSNIVIDPSLNSWIIATETNCPLYIDYLISINDNSVIFTKI